MRSWSCVLAMVVVFGGVAAEGLAGTRSDVTALLLTKQDAGAGYSLIRDGTHRWTLAERSGGMGSTLRREFAAKWVAGAVTGFGGSAVVAHQSIASYADVFRTSSFASIRRAWEATYLDLGKGARLPIPRGAPGDARFLMRGRMLSNGTRLEVLLYQWQQGKTLRSVWLIARPGVPRVSRLITLAHLQAANPKPVDKATRDREQVQSNVRSSIPAIEAYAADRPSTGYSGMTVAKLRVIDAGIANVEIVRAGLDTYCVQDTVGGQTASFSRPAAELVLAPC